MMTSNAVFTLILAGGSGTRFWPLSREHAPKQLLPLLGGDPLILETARRALPLTGGWSRVLVGTGRRLAAPTLAILRDLPHENLLVEPAPRNTAPCIGWAASRVARIDPEAVIMVLPSDHHIRDVESFRAVLAAAVASASRGVITTIGIRPTRAETGYGYIEIDMPSDVAEPCSTTDPLHVRRFVEKPDRAHAEAFLASGRYLWNAGMFFFRACDMLDALAAHQPALREGLESIASAGPPGSDAEQAALDRVFPTLPAVSIDRGVMEHIAELAVVPGDFGWSDLGSWQTAWELSSTDDLGNAAPPASVLVDARSNLVVDLRTDTAMRRRIIALVGVDDLVVVETDDALLVMPRSRAQDVRHVVDGLKARGDEDFT